MITPIFLKETNTIGKYQEKSKNHLEFLCSKKLLFVVCETRFHLVVLACLELAMNMLWPLAQCHTPASASEHSN